MLIVSNVTENLGKYVKAKHINLTGLAEDTGVSYQTLYTSLIDGKRIRELRANELASVCYVLGVNPMDFADTPEKEEI